MDLSSLRPDGGSSRPQPQKMNFQMGRYQFDQKDFDNFQKYVHFINAEWGLELELVSDQQMFTSILQTNSAKYGQPIITFRDISVLFVSKYKLKPEDRKMIKFLEAESLKILTKSDEVIFSSRQSSPSLKNYIIQIGQ